MRHVVEIRATGPDDPSGVRSAAVLAAYFHLEEVQRFCGLLWPRLAALALGWILVAGLLPGMSRGALEGGLAMFGLVGTGALMVERRAIKNLNRLIRALPPTLRAHRRG